MDFSLLLQGDPDDLLALEAALRGDPQVKGSTVERIVRDPGPEELGPVTEALAWAGDNKELLGAVAAAVAAWLSGRRTRLRIRVGKEEIEVSSANVPDPEALALTLLAALRDRDV